MKISSPIFAFIFLTRLVFGETNTDAASKPFQIEDFELAAQGYVAHVIFKVKSSPFLNAHNTKASPVEALADYALMPVRYIFHGTDVTDGVAKRSFTYDKKSMGRKTIASLIALPSSLLTGACLKALACLTSSSTRSSLSAMHHPKAPKTNSNRALYKELGISQISSEEEAPCLHLPRGPFLYPGITHDIDALRDIAKLLNQHEIPFWLDDGSCLGAYRHGGVIPWDNDVDMAILEPDFDNALAALSALDQNKYMLQDWSGALAPKTYLRVLVKETKTLIDLYCYSIDKERRTIRYIYALEDSPYISDKWKNRERNLVHDIPFEKLFPLKKLYFEGIWVSVPAQIEAWLQVKYGENISPARLWDETRSEYVKDEAHPYWKQSPV